MISRYDLNQYRDMKKEISKLCNKIRIYQNKNKIFDLVRGTSDIFPYVERSFKIEGVDKKTQEIINEYLELLKNKYNQLMLKKIELENFIINIPTSRLRQIFEYKYIDNYKWNKIAYLIGGNSTADSIRKEHDRYLEEN